MISFVIAGLFALSKASDPDVESRISSGYPAVAGSLKCYLTLQIEGETTGQKLCSGCLLPSEDKIITAASCVFSPFDGKATVIRYYLTLAGPDGPGADLDVLDIYKPPGFDAGSNKSTSDIAIIALNTRIKIHDEFTSIPEFKDAVDAYVGENLLACGHGVIDNKRTKPGSKGLQCTFLRVVPSAECVTLLSSGPTATTAAAGRRKRQAPAITGIICTKNNDDRNVCSGDQGTPVYSNKTGSLAVVGVVSNYPDTRPNARCKDGHYAVITQLGAFKDFINDPAKTALLS